MEKANQEKGLEGLRGKKKGGMNSQPHSESTEPRHLVSCLQDLGLPAPTQPRGKGPHLSRPQSSHLEAGNNSPCEGDRQPESDTGSDLKLNVGKVNGRHCCFSIVSCSNTAVHLQWLLNFFPIES